MNTVKLVLAAGGVSAMVALSVFAQKAPPRPNGGARPPRSGINQRPGVRLASLRAEDAAPTPGQLQVVRPDRKPAGLCPLRHTSVEADVSGFVARVTVRQQFHNPSTSPVEAVYTFPLPADAAVDDMTLTVGDRVIRGQVRRREEARQIYENAKHAGQSAALLDQERPNIFTQAVANLMPGAEVSVAISYVHLLKYEAGAYEFVFPMVVGPRYVAGGGYSSPGARGEAVRGEGADTPVSSVVTDAEKITPPVTPPGTRAGHDIDVTVRLDAGLPVQDVEAALHAVDIERPTPTRAVVRLRDGDRIPNKDFILRYGVAGGQVEAGVLAHAEPGGEGHFTLILQPPAAPDPAEVAAKEMVFVIDQTGSQSGFPIEKSKETLKFCLENLNPRDTFQLIGFNTEVFPCFPSPVPVSPENVQAALRYLEPLQGNGGTDILKSVDYALRIPTDPTRPRIVCYMTDGYVGNDMQIVDYIRKHRGDVRIFPFGVGNSVNRFLIDAMAREGRGAAEYVDLRMPGEKAASKFYDRVAKPLLLDVTVDWGGMAVEDVLPRQIPDVFASTPIVLKGRYQGARSGDVNVRGLLRGRPWSRTVHVELPAARAENAALPSLWARERIEELQCQDYLGAQSGRPDPAITQQIVGLALDYRLMSQHTSFVAVEERVVNLGGRQRKIDVPVELPDGVAYEGIFGGEQEVGVRAGAGMAASYFRQSLSAVGAGSPAMALPPAAALPALGAGGANGPGGGMAAKGGSLQQAARLAAPAPRTRGTTLSLAEVAGDAAAPTPKDRLSTALRQRLTAARALKGAAGTRALEARVEVQVWIDRLPPEGLRQLRALGFELAAELQPGRLLLGTLPLRRLEALGALAWVRRLEEPHLRN